MIHLIGVLAPQRLRADWRQEWEAELRYRETLPAEWDNLNWQTKLGLWRRSIGALWDALLLQPRGWEDEMFQDLRFGLRIRRSVVIYENFYSKRDKNVFLACAIGRHRLLEHGALVMGGDDLTVS